MIFIVNQAKYASILSWFILTLCGRVQELEESVTKHKSDNTVQKGMFAISFYVCVSTNGHFKIRDILLFYCTVFTDA